MRKLLLTTQALALVFLYTITDCFSSKDLCFDRYPDCPKNAKQGMCENRPSHFLHVCRRSCGACGNVRCKDYHRACSLLTKAAYCSRAGVMGDFMATWCRKSCRKCGVATPTPQPTKRPTANPSSDSCGIKPKTAKIVGGTISQRNNWPWMAQLLIHGIVFCGGTLVSPQWVVTASHCVVHLNSTQLNIRLGAHFKYGSIGTEQDFTVEKIIVHPSYNRPIGLSSDIALVKLNRPASPTLFVISACLPTATTPFGFYAGKNCWVTGWGALSFGGASGNQLRQARVPIQTDAACRKAYTGRVDRTMVCAGLNQGGIDACQGDSGGPLVCSYGGRWFLEGVVSWGDNCAAPGKFGVYAKVRILQSWLRKTIKSN